KASSEASGRAVDAHVRYALRVPGHAAAGRVGLRLANLGHARIAVLHERPADDALVVRAAAARAAVDGAGRAGLAERTDAVSAHGRACAAVARARLTGLGGLADEVAARHAVAAIGRAVRAGLERAAHAVAAVRGARAAIGGTGLTRFVRVADRIA